MHITHWATSIYLQKSKNLLLDHTTLEDLITWFESDGIKEYPIKQVYNWSILNFNLNAASLSKDDSFVFYYTGDHHATFNFKDEESVLLFKLKYL